MDLLRHFFNIDDVHCILLLRCQEGMMPSTHMEPGWPEWPGW